MAEGSEEDKESKTEEPSERKITKAQEEGNVPISKDLGHWVMLCTFSFVLFAILPHTVTYLTKSLVPFIAAAHTFRLQDGDLTRFFIHILNKVGMAILLPLLFFMVAAISFGLWQTQKAITLKKIQPQFSNLSLAKGLSRIFSKQALVELVKNIAKLSILSLGFYYSLHKEFDGLDYMLMFSIGGFKERLFTLIFKVLMVVLVAMGFLGFLDYLYQRHQHRENLRMTKHEMKEEYKETEGSPEVKQRLRQLRMQGGRKRMIEAVPGATAVITNPTHYAIAVLWDEHSMTAPKVVAKGKNDIALRIREVAKQHSIPIVENPPLARSLYDGVDLEREIEPQHYQAVAEVIRFVITLKAKRF